MKKNRPRAVLFLRDEREDIFVGDGVPDVPTARQRRAVIARRGARSAFWWTDPRAVIRSLARNDRGEAQGAALHFCTVSVK